LPLWDQDGVATQGFYNAIATIGAGLGLSTIGVVAVSAAGFWFGWLGLAGGVAGVVYGVLMLVREARTR
jgi:hypothetical protein